MERQYETVCILRPDLGEEAVKAIIQKSRQVLEGAGAKVEKVEEWGRRRLGYRMKKRAEGFYFLLDFTGGPAATTELERVLRFNEDVLRYQTIKKEKAVEKVEPKEAPKEEGNEQRENA